jgi:hypothetical protein
VCYNNFKLVETTRTKLAAISQESEMIQTNLKSPKFMLFFASLLVVISLLALPIAAAYAEGTGPVPPISGLGRVPNATLRRMLLRERTWMANQGTVFKDANKLSISFQLLINHEKTKGKDVTDLQIAMNNFDAELLVADGIYKNAIKVLVANSGFDGSFNVTDRAAAGVTFLTARGHLRDAHFRLVTAMDNLRRTYKRWLSHNL